ncbi:YadA-like family protein [Gallibacterium salpingitidis]|uniref:YadA-like family protein n=1 Tax=Gallibacterium salpingitidis TaxID=505341 RepID=UPI0026709A37|nr:YadA-like family protein [Gallibacterium salpingitidis]WKS98656.1 YadA-like family protein [Gallibacterium salpingitidis]
MKKTTLALLLSAILSASATAEETQQQPNIVNITINNIGDDSGLEMGAGSRARGAGSIATGKNSVALGKNAVATGGNETKDSINAKLAENKQKLADIATAEANTNRLLSELQNIRKVEADVIEAGERVKQVRLAKQSAYNVWQEKLKTYNDTVAGSAQFLRDAQAKIDDLNSRLTGVSRIGNVDISSDEGLTNAATQLKSIVEEGTTLNLSVDFYKDYVSSYYRALGDLRSAIQLNNSFIRAYSSSGNLQYLAGSSLYHSITNQSITPGIIKSIEINQDCSWDGSYCYSVYYLNSDGVISYSRVKGETLNINYNAGDATLPLITSNIANESVINEEQYHSILNNYNRVLNAVEKTADNYPYSEFMPDNYKLDIKNGLYRLLLTYKANLDKMYFQWKYEQTHETTWLDKKANTSSLLQEKLKNYPVSNSLYDLNTLFRKNVENYYSQWKKENITDVIEKNKLTTETLTAELEKALGINKNAIAEKEAEIARLKTAADQAKSTYDNTNPSAADLALSQRYEEIMRQLTAKANELKSEQDRLQALRDALTLNDLTNVGENAYAIGTNALATGANSLAIGTDTIVTGENSIAIGKGSAVTGTNSIAIGTGHNVLGNNSGAFGDPNYIYGDGSYAFGNNNTIGNATKPHQAGNNTFVLGSNVVTTANHAIILGANSADGGDNTVSVGSAAAQRKIVYVADGTISQTSKDAINGSQIHDILENGTAVNVENWKTLLEVGSTENSATATALSNLASDVAKHLDGGSSVDTNGRVTAPTYSITDVTSTTPTAKNYSNVGAALTALDSNTKALNTTLGKKADKTDITNINTSLDGINTALNGKANTSLNNITSDGETVIKNLAKGAVKVIAGTNTTVTESTDGDAKTYAVNVSNEAIKGAVQKDLDGKANKDASNLVSADVQKWQEKLGNGKNTKGDKGLITGDTLNTALTAALSDKANKTDITNINTSLDGINTALNGKANTNLNNLTTDGETVIKNLAKGAVKVIAGTNTTVTESTDGDAKTYAVNVSNEAIKGAVQKDLDGKANKDASNLVSADVQKWQEKLGNGKNAKGDKGLITGDTLNIALETKADKGDITTINTSLSNKANTDLDNITNNGKTTIKNLANEAVEIVNGTNTTVSKTVKDGNTLYAVNVSNNDIKEAIQPDLNTKANTDASNIDAEKYAKKLGIGTISETDKNLVNGKTVYTAIQNAVINGIDISNKADRSAKNLTAQDVENWQAKLGTNEVKANSKQLITSSAVHSYVRDMTRNTLAQANTYTDMRINGLKQHTDKQIKQLKEETRAGIASAMAMGAIPTVSNKRYSVGAGTATFRGESAVAIGLRVKSDKDNAVVSFSASASSNGDIAGAAGFAFGF